MFARTVLLCLAALAVIYMVMTYRRRTREKELLWHNEARHRAIVQFRRDEARDNQGERERKTCAVAFEIPTCEKNLHDLLTLLQDTENLCEKNEVLLSIGDSYSRGCFPLYRPNVSLATECYRTVSRCHDPLIAGTASVKLESTMRTPLLQVDVRGSSMPRECAIQACSMLSSLNSMHHREVVLAPVLPEAYPPLVTFLPPRAVTAAPVVELAPAPLIIIDLQNSHDTVVVAAVTARVADLKFNTIPLEEKRSVPERVIEALSFSADLTIEEQKNATRVVSSLGDENHGTFDISERAALSLVWDSIMSMEDPVVRINMIETLGKQLASAVERNNVVCSTGKIARIISSLDGTPAQDETVIVRPLYAVKEELACLASQIREQHLTGLSQEDVELYEQGSLPNSTEAMRAEFVVRGREIYVEGLKMHCAVLDPLLEVYSEGF